jgi:hypothetical protein
MLSLNLKNNILAVAAVCIAANIYAGPKESVQKKETIKWAVQKASTLTIQGSTNISTFGCDIAGYYRPDTISYLQSNNTGDLVTLAGSLEIDITKFDCHNRMLTSDLRKTLKATDYPMLVIRFLSFERAPLVGNKRDFLKGWVELEIAGVARRFELCYSLCKTGCAQIQLNGKRSFSFADFNLVPPRKMGGLIKVRDEFNVDFNLLLTRVE